MARLWPLRLKAASGGSTTRRNCQSSGTSLLAVKMWMPPNTPLAASAVQLVIAQS